MHFSTNPFFIYFPTFRLLPHSLSRNCWCHNWHNFNRNKHLLRYDKNIQSSSLPELIFLFRTGLISKLSLISRIYLWCSYAKMLNLSKYEILLQIRKWSRVALSFDGLTFLNVKGNIPICSPDLISSAYCYSYSYASYDTFWNSCQKIIILLM